MLICTRERYTALRHTPDPRRPAGPCRQCELEGGATVSGDAGLGSWEMRSGEPGHTPRPLPRA